MVSHVPVCNPKSFLESEISTLLTPVYHTNTTLLPCLTSSLPHQTELLLPVRDTCIPNFRTRSWDNRANPAQTVLISQTSFSICTVPAAQRTPLTVLSSYSPFSPPLL